jgi:hypothetical protein
MWVYQAQVTVSSSHLVSRQSDRIFLTPELLQCICQGGTLLELVYSGVLGEQIVSLLKLPTGHPALVMLEHTPVHQVTASNTADRQRYRSHRKDVRKLKHRLC